MAVAVETYIDQPATSQVIKKITDLGSTATQLSSTATDRVISIKADNSKNSVATFLKFWNSLAAGVTVGTTPPHWVVEIGPKVSGDDDADGIQEITIPDGVEFATAITVAATTTANKAGSTAPSSQFDVEIALDAA
jgi:hypothetical protein